MGNDGQRRERLEVGVGGWCRFEWGDRPNLVVWARVTLQGGRWRAVDLFVQAVEQQQIDVATLRDIPLARLDAWVNSPKVAPKIAEYLKAGEAINLRSIVETFQSEYTEVVTGARLQAYVNLRATVSAKSQVSAHATVRPSTVQAKATIGHPAATRKMSTGKLRIPEGRRYNDGFYMQVAEVYGDLVRSGQPPAQVMHTMNDVPVTTVHRWVREARRRGFLGPGRPGKAG